MSFVWVKALCNNLSTLRIDLNQQYPGGMTLLTPPYDLAAYPISNAFFDHFIIQFFKENIKLK